jgi:hypothetical protein
VTGDELELDADDERALELARIDLDRAEAERRAAGRARWHRRPGPDQGIDTN